MKALSIKQPWASLIAKGIKDIENRTWPTNYRGKIYIHSSQKSAGQMFDLLTIDQYDDVILKGLKSSTDKPTSAIIGEVEIVDCVINHGSIWAEKTPSCSPHHKNGLRSEIGRNRKDAIYNWVLANAVLYDKPILNVKGKLSFWEFNESEVSNG